MTKTMMRDLARVGRRLVADSGGQDLIEYALLTGIIAVGGALVFPTIRDKMGAAYQAWLSGGQAIWEPPPPTGT
jgi:Flp pilus assembly pilin Flp